MRRFFSVLRPAFGFLPALASVPALAFAPAFALMIVPGATQRAMAQDAAAEPAMPAVPVDRVSVDQLRDPGVIYVEPYPAAQDRLQEALLLVEPGGVIELAAGRYALTDGLSLDVDNVTVRGKGMDQTILSFADQQAGSEGLLVTGDKAVLANFAVEDAKGDAIKAKGVNGISIINVRTEWTGGPKSTNGAYGVYPVESKNVLIDGVVAIGASDAGIYVGQSENIVVRNSRAQYNVAGIEIENSYYADVFDNIATRNTGGILVFDLPDLPQQGGHDIRVFRNQIVSNDTPNFAPEGNIVGDVPVGTGVLVMANRNVEIFENQIGDNQTANLLVVGYVGDISDPDYDPLPKGVSIHNNAFGRGGWRPDDNEIGRILVDIVGTPVPDIVWDGRAPFSQLILGLPAENRIYVQDNRRAAGGTDPVSFANLNIFWHMALPWIAAPSRNIKAHRGDLPVEIQPVVLPEEQRAIMTTWE